MAVLSGVERCLGCESGRNLDPRHWGLVFAIFVHCLGDYPAAHHDPHAHTGTLSAHDGVVCLWSRHTHPEELPFIDDEPSLNDQYAEIEKVRQSHRTASEIADSALKHIRERAETYDQPTGERSAAKTAKAFNAITGKDITESEVWLLLQLLKDVRQWSREDYHQDSAEDCIAYAALKAESLEGGE